MTLTVSQEQAMDEIEVIAMYARYGDETFLRDLLADLMHFADVREIDFNEELRIAYDNYAEEANNGS